MADLVPTYRIGSFGAYRVNTPKHEFALDFRYGIDPLLVGSSTSGAGAVQPLDSDRAVRLTVGATAADKVTLQTHEYFGGRIGPARRFAAGVKLDVATNANQTIRWGTFSNGASVNGSYFMVKDGVFGLAIRKNGGTEVFTPAASFNVDPVYASALDLTKVNMFEAQVEFLGGGAYINGILVHKIDVAGVLSAPLISGERMPIRFEIENTGTSAPNAITLYDAIFWTEGETAIDGASFSRSASNSAVGSTELPLLSLRPKATFGFGAAGPHKNHVRLIPRLLNVEAASRIKYRVRLSPTLTGPAWTSHNVDSAVEYDTSATLVTDGRVLLEWDASQSISISADDFGENAFRMLLLEYPTETPRFISITAQRSGGGTIDASCSFTWVEDR